MSAPAFRHVENNFAITLLTAPWKTTTLEGLSSFAICWCGVKIRLELSERSETPKHLIIQDTL